MPRSERKETSVGDSEAVMRPILVSQGWLLEYFPGSWSRQERRSGRSYFLTTGPHLFSPFPKVKLCPERAWGQPCINTQTYVGSPNRATQKALIGRLGQL